MIKGFLRLHHARLFDESPLTVVKADGQPTKRNRKVTLPLFACGPWHVHKPTENTSETIIYTIGGNMLPVVESPKEIEQQIKTLTQE